MEEKGHEVIFVARKKEIAHCLLNLYNIPYISRGRGRHGRIGKVLYSIYANAKLFLIARKHKPDLFLNFLHPYPSQVARLLGKVSLVFSDTEHADLHHKLTLPFVTKIYTPSCYRLSLGKKQVRFNGFMELAYLHPNYYSPNPDVLNQLGVHEKEKYVIVRFVSWTATHDFGHTGMSLENKRKAVKSMSRYAKVFISAEGELPPDLEHYRIKLPFNRMHDAVYYSSLLFGESATMASEAAILGTPSIFIDNDGRGYTDEEEMRYGIVFNFTESESDQQEAIAKAVNILSDDSSRLRFKNVRDVLILDSIDTTRFMVDEVLKYDT